MRKRWIALALPLVLQLAFADVAYADEEINEDRTILAQTAGVRVNGVEVQKISNPRVKLIFDVDPNLIDVGRPEWAAGQNPDDPNCGVAHNPADKKINMTIVADLEAGATGSQEILVEYTEWHNGGTVMHTHQAYSKTEDIGTVGPAGMTLRVPLCIF